MKLLIFVLSTLFVSYKLAGIGGLILSLVPLALILSFTVSTIRFQRTFIRAGPFVSLG